MKTSTREGGRAHRLWLAVSVALFLGALYFVVVGPRRLHDWLLLVATFANATTFAILARRRPRAE